MFWPTNGSPLARICNPGGVMLFKTFIKVQLICTTQQEHLKQIYENILSFKERFINYIGNARITNPRELPMGRSARAGFEKTNNVKHD